MTTKLKLYNRALLYCRERQLAALTDNSPSRRALDAVWDSGYFISRVLEMGFWNCAMRTVLADYTPSVEPSFGLARAFAKPDDWVRTYALSADEYFTEPLRQYTDEGGYWFAEYDELYVQYVSSSDAYGGDLSRWPESLATAAAYLLAYDAAPALGLPETRIDKLEQDKEKAFLMAKSTDAMNQPTALKPMGGWEASRSRRGGRRDRGNRNNLYG